MEPNHTAKKLPWQFSVRSAFLVIALLAICMAIILVQFRRVQRQAFVANSVRPLIEKHVSSVGYANRQIVWLRVNDIDPHHANHFDQWAVPITMDMYINNGSFGPYSTFDDKALRKFVTDHPHVRALDLRDSGVTDDGLRNLTKLKQLEWLWLDGSQSTAIGLSHLHGLRSLRTAGLDLDSIDPALIRTLKRALASCTIESYTNASEP